MFDINSFMNAATGAASTKRLVVPAGVYPATIVKIEPKQGTIGKGDRIGQPWLALNVTWQIDDPTIAESVGRSSVQLTQSIMFDLDENGDIATGEGMNWRYGKFRDAIGKNNPGDVPADFIGQSAKIQVVHELYEGEIQERVKAATKL